MRGDEPKQIRNHSSPFPRAVSFSKLGGKCNAFEAMPTHQRGWSIRHISPSTSDETGSPSCNLNNKQQRKLSSSISRVNSGIGSKLRRASESLRSAFQVTSGKSKYGSDCERPVFEPTPITTARNSDDAGEPEDLARPTTGRPHMLVDSLSQNTVSMSGLSLNGRQPSGVDSWRSLPTAPGAAARLSAARQNQHDRIVSRSSSTVDFDLRRSRLERDRESAVSLCIEPRSRGRSTEPNSSSVSRLDPLSVLPMELAALAFQQLDYNSLARAEQVSRQWQRIASDSQLWKAIFVRQFGTRSPISVPGPVGGRGIGGPSPLQDWKNMYRARIDLAENWKHKHATVVHLNGHTDSVYCLQYDEEKIVTGSRDRTIRVWDIRTFKCLKVIGVPCALEADRRAGPTIRDNPATYPGFSTFTLSHQPLDSDSYHVPTYYHNASILCLQYDEDITVTGSSDCSLIMWDMKTWEPIRRLERHTGGVLDVVFDKKRIVSCSKDTSICLWDRHTGKLLHQLVGHRGPVNAVQLRGDLLVSASGEGCARLWNLGSAGLPLAYGSRCGQGKETDFFPRCTKEFWSRDRGLACVEFSNDARYILAGGNDRSIYKFDTSTGGLVSIMEGHSDLVRSLYLDYDNGHVISGSYDLSLRVWDFENCEQLLEFPNWSASWMLSAKCDYRRIISTSQDGRILVVDFGWAVKGIELLKGQST